MLKDIIALFVNFLNMQTGTILTAGASWAIGVSFKDLITSIVTSIIQPLITKVFIWLNINKLIKISGMKNFLSSKNSILNISNVIITLISFILIVFTVYFTVDFLQKISSQVNDK